MTRSIPARSGMLVSALAAATILLAGCAGAAETTGETMKGMAGLVGEQSDSGEPTSGGTLSYATFTGISTLDPADRQDSGVSGGSEMAAIYDLLMRFDPETKEYQPQLAQSLTANPDDTVWTLTLRDGVKFSDGTPLDAAAVQWSINHYLAKKGIHSQVWNATVAGIDAPDPNTVVFTLQRPWNEFPILLTSGPGMVVAPSSMDTGAFAPVGAGPFVVEKFSPQEDLTLAASPTYWGGKPRLDKLRFPVIAGDQPRLDAMHTGGVQVAYLRRPEVIQAALDAGDAGYLHTVSMGSVGLINQRPDRPASDVRVRKAIVAAFNPEVFNDRVEEGHGMPGSAIFQPWSQWAGSVAGNGYDPEAAKRNLADAMADGYDGKLTYVGSNTAETQRNALAYQSMLQAVGFNVEISYSPSTADLIRRTHVDHDFDIAHSGLSVLEESPFIRLYGNFYSESPANALGYKNPAMDTLLTELQTAQTEEARRLVAEKLQVEINNTAPLITIGAGRVFIPWQQNVHGIAPSSDGVLLFDDAWLATPGS